MKRIKLINKPDFGAVERAKIKWNNVAKPLHSLGLLEEAVVKIQGIIGNENFDLNKLCALMMCVDYVVICEGGT